MLRSLKEYPENYREIYSSYEKFSNKANIVKRFIDEEFTDILKSSQFKLNDENKPIRILSIGSGSGVKDIHLLHKLKHFYPNSRMEVTVVEPCNDYIDEYKRRIELDDVVNVETNFNWRCQTSGEYRSEFSSNDNTDNFHLIVLFEVLYYEEDLEKALKFYLDRLDGEKGLILAALNVRETSWSRMHREFSFFEGSASPIGVEDVEKTLRKLSCKFETFVKKNPYQLDFVFEKENKDGDNVISILTHVVNFREEASGDQIEFYEKLIKKHSRYDDGHYFFDTDIGIIVVRKS